MKSYSNKFKICVVWHKHPKIIKLQSLEFNSLRFIDHRASMRCGPQNITELIRNNCIEQIIFSWLGLKDMKDFVLNFVSSVISSEYTAFRIL